MLLVCVGRENPRGAGKTGAQERRQWSFFRRWLPSCGVSGGGFGCGEWGEVSRRRRQHGPRTNRASSGVGRVHRREKKSSKAVDRRRREGPKCPRKGLGGPPVEKIHATSIVR